jgi:hypothetical protein
VEARNRDLDKWFSRIESGEVLLPRFQRHEAWGHKEVTSLLESVLRGLPTGAALTLEIGDAEPFVARPLVGAPEPIERVTEHLLDGQQRLTALWRSLHDDYDDRVFLIGSEESENGEDGGDRIAVRAQPTYAKNGSRYPLWIASPAECWARGYIPISVCRPGLDQAEVRSWARAATGDDDDAAWELAGRIIEFATAVAKFNVPFLSLPVGTPRETALDVFINMNTSAVRLTSYDIVVAQYEAANDKSLHDDLEGLASAVPRLHHYRDPEDLLLDIAALREDRTPSQASYHRLDLERLSDEFDAITKGAAFAVEVLEHECIFDADRLPTVAVLPVLGAIEAHVPAGGDERGNAISLIRSYLWRAFSTSRYESSAGTRALQDLRGLIEALAGRSNTAPIFDEELFPVPTSEELVRARWPKTRQTLARAILCASLRRGAFDLADGARATATNMETREYHHLYPDAYLEQQAGLDKSEIYRALNCALITWQTNRRIGAKPPLTYLEERVERSHFGEDEIRRRLESHLMPWDEFANPGDDVAASYRSFLHTRAAMVGTYLSDLCAGREPNS